MEFSELKGKTIKHIDGMRSYLDTVKFPFITKKKPTSEQKPDLRPELLLHPNIPKPLHGVSPRSIFGQKWWDEQRQEAYKSTEYHCAACGVHNHNAKYHKWLEAHEIYEFDYEKATLTFTEIVPLCHSCHNYIHSGRMQILVDKGEFPEEKMQDILSHGLSVVATYTGKIKQYKYGSHQWSDWKMIIYGKEYSPMHESYNSWSKYYNTPSIHYYLDPKESVEIKAKTRTGKK